MSKVTPAILALFVLLSVSPAHAQNTKAVFEKYNLLGTFSVNCSKPAARDNYYIVRRAIDDDRVQVDVMIGSTERFAANVIDRAMGLGPNELTIHVTTEKNESATLLLRIEPGRMRTVESTSDEGKKGAVDGRDIESKQPTPWMNKCDGDSVRAVLEKRNLLGTFAVNCGKPATPANPYMVHRPLDSTRVQVDYMVGPKKVVRTVVIDHAAEAGANDVALSMITDHSDYIYRIEGNRFRIMTRTVRYGQMSFKGDTLIADGKDVKTGADYLWMTKCKG